MASSRKARWCMSLSRRDFVRMAGWIAGGAAIGGACAPLTNRLAAMESGTLAWPPVDAADFRRLARMTFGPTAFELDRVAAIGIEGWIEEQLAPEDLEDPGMQLRLWRFDSLNMEPDGLERFEPSDVAEALRAATILRRVYSRRQLYERWVEFWTDHFNISIDKGECWLLKPADDRRVIRPLAFDRFQRLLSASAHSPAMLVYLDNQANRAGAPNENYAREVMELHTIGVGSGYSQQDVMELARCLTGWTTKDHFWKGEFTFDPDRHDSGSKRVLGKQVQPAGESEAQSILDLLATHRATADHLATKLVARFITDQPERDAPDLVAKVSATFQRTRGDLRQVARTLFLDGIGHRGGAMPTKIKRPVDLVTSALRGLSANTDGGRPLQEHLGAMGQALFNWPTPDGPPDTAPPWSGNLMPRWQFAIALGLDEIRGTSLELAAGEGPEQWLSDLSTRLLGVQPPPELRAALSAVTNAVGLDASLARVLAAGLIASPQFQWR
jgi:hypothetical protein